MPVGLYTNSQLRHHPVWCLSETTSQILRDSQSSPAWKISNVFKCWLKDNVWLTVSSSPTKHLISPSWSQFLFKCLVYSLGIWRCVELDSLSVLLLVRWICPVATNHHMQIGSTTCFWHSVWWLLCIIIIIIIIIILTNIVCRWNHLRGFTSYWRILCVAETTLRGCKTVTWDV